MSYVAKHNEAYSTERMTAEDVTPYIMAKAMIYQRANFVRYFRNVEGYVHVPKHTA